MRTSDALNDRPAAWLADKRAAVAVFFDGGCPVCRREIAWYSAMRGGDAIEWIDISGDLDGIAGLPEGVDRDALLSRFTIRRRDGAVVSGGAGFIAVWRALAVTRVLGLITDHGAGRWIAERAYRVFLRIRTLWR